MQGSRPLAVLRAEAVQRSPAGHLLIIGQQVHYSYILVVVRARVQAYTLHRMLHTYTTAHSTGNNTIFSYETIADPFRDRKSVV